MKRVIRCVIAFIMCFSVIIVTNSSVCYAGYASGQKNIAGAWLYGELTCSTTSVTAAASFYDDIGTVSAAAYGYYVVAGRDIRIQSYSSNPVPGGVSASVSCPDYFSFFAAEGVYSYSGRRGATSMNLYVPLN